MKIKSFFADSEGPTIAMKTLVEVSITLFMSSALVIKPTKPDEIENQTEVSSQNNLVKESLRMQKVSKIRITITCATKTTSDLGKVTLLQIFHDFFSLFVSL